MQMKKNDTFTFQYRIDSKQQSLNLRDLKFILEDLYLIQCSHQRPTKLQFENLLNNYPSLKKIQEDNTKLSNQPNYQYQRRKQKIQKRKSQYGLKKFNKLPFSQQTCLHMEKVYLVNQKQEESILKIMSQLLMPIKRKKLKYHFQNKSSSILKKQIKQLKYEYQEESYKIQIIRIILYFNIKIKKEVKQISFRIMQLIGSFEDQIITEISFSINKLYYINLIQKKY
ncbi:unnamed protein product [Paramecium sonneborni]|uniref:Uncharacterized protein n=1 Tax=Paramecium sonneborni TaxID=65129 RepID=A0A8S1PPU5_9CILI|nr:unnamed protein product [Paramecium sonneborni]